MRFTLIIPTTGEKSELENLLYSLDGLAGIEDAEILLVINPPESRSKASIPRLQLAKVQILTSEKGVNNARNKGLETACGEIIFFFDDDCYLINNNHLLIHERQHQEGSSILGFGGGYYDPRKSDLATTYCFLQNQWLELNFNPMAAQNFCLLGGNFSLKKRLLNNHKFDSSILYGGSETEFFLRMAKLGFSFRRLNLFVGHLPTLDRKIFVKKFLLQAKTHRKLERSNLLPAIQFIPLPGINTSRWESIYRKAFNPGEGRFLLRIFFRRLTNYWEDYLLFLKLYLKNRSLFLNADESRTSLDKKILNSR